MPVISATSGLPFTPGKVFNPGDYGGHTFAGIRAAIAAAAAAHGGIVQLEDRRYVHDGTPLIMQQGVTLRGTHKPGWIPVGGATGTQLDASGQTGPTLWLIDPAILGHLETSATIEGIIFVGGTDVMSSNGSSAVLLRDLEFVNFAGSAIRLRGQQEWWWVQNVIMSGLGPVGTYGIRHEEFGVGDAGGAPSLQKVGFYNVMISNVATGILSDTNAGNNNYFANLRINFCGDCALDIRGQNTAWVFHNLTLEFCCWFNQSFNYAQTTGSISAGSSALSVASAAGFAVGDTLTVEGAGAGGRDLQTTLSAIVGTTFTLASAAASTVSGKEVNSNTRCAIWLRNTQQFQGNPGPALISFYNCDLTTDSALYALNAAGASGGVILHNVTNTRPVYDPGYASVLTGPQTWMRQPASYTNSFSGYMGTVALPGPLHLGPAGSAFNTAYGLDVQGSSAGVRAGGTLLGSVGTGLYAAADTARCVRLDGIGQSTQLCSPDGIALLPGVGAGALVRDSFTLAGAETADENLAAHTGELGAIWTEQSSNVGQLVVTAAGRIAVGGTTSASYFLPEYTPSGSPPSADYRVQADFFLPSVPAGAFAVGLKGRAGAGGSPSYSMQYDAAAGWLLKNTSTTLASSPATLSAGALHTMALHMAGTSIWGTLDGATILGPVSDATISTAGAAGIFVYIDNTGTPYVPSDAGGPQFDNFLVSSGTAAGLVIDDAGHLLATAPAPTVAAQAGAGASPPAPTLSGNELRGTITWGTGTAAAAGAQLSVTYAAAYASAPTVTIAPANDATTQIGVAVTSQSATGFVVSAHAPASGQAGGTYAVTYIVLG